MLAKRLDPIDTYRQRQYLGSPIYKNRLRSRKLSIHARFVAEATEIFPGASLIDIHASDDTSKSKKEGY